LHRLQTIGKRQVGEMLLAVLCGKAAVWILCGTFFFFLGIMMLLHAWLLPAFGLVFLYSKFVRKFSSKQKAFSLMFYCK